MNFEVSSKNIFFHRNSEYQLPPLTDHIFSILSGTQQKQQPIGTCGAKSNQIKYTALISEIYQKYLLRFEKKN